MAKSKHVSKVAEPAASATYSMLDPAEVMKAMLAQKGKGKQVIPDSDSELGSAESASEEDDDGKSQDDSDRDTSVEEQGGEEAASIGSEAESSRSAELRHRKRSRSNSREVHQPASRVAPIATSRVNLDPQTRSQVSSSRFSEVTKPSPVTTFETLGMSKPLISALASINIKQPTEIQAACVGAIMSGRDCIGGAKTGSGKTLAFALPIVERIARDPFGVWAVVLTPTRYVLF
jgi:ATP-dependent RNA helicase DDX49/DBP8